MQRYTFSILLILGLVLTGACTKVIDLDIQDSDKKVVIEAELQDGTHPFKVLISHSSFYNDPYSSSAIENATVILSDNQGLSTLIPHTSGGVYTETISAVAGNTYTLSVNIDGVTYTASSTMQDDIAINTMYTEFVAEPPFGGDPGTRIKYEYSDPAGQRNFYRAKHYINNVLQTEPSDLIFFNDDISDGNVMSRSLGRDLFASGQTVRLELIHIDENAYNYLYTLSDIMGSAIASSAAPSNPVTNWSNGAMGLFSTHNIDTMSVVIP